MKKIFLCFMGVFMVPCLVYGAGDYTTNKDFYGDLKVNVPGGTSYIKTDFGLIMDNSLSAGIRYSF